MHELAKYKKNFTSQDGEDGIIQEIINRLGLDSGWCVELGASDGKRLSNSWTLWHDKGWNAILIESEHHLMDSLRSRVASFPKVHAIERRIEYKDENSLDSTLSQFEIPNDFELLSLDIDGNDFIVWRNLRKYSPQIVVIEFNETFPLNVEYHDNPSQNNSLGSSARDMFNLAVEKGYILASSTSLNLIFLREDVFPKLGIQSPNLDKIFPTHRLTHVISSFEGIAVLDRERPLHIHISSQEGIKNQVNYRDLNLPDPYHQVVILSKSGNPLLIDLLRFFLNNPLLLKLFGMFRKVTSSLRRANRPLH